MIFYLLRATETAEKTLIAAEIYSIQGFFNNSARLRNHHSAECNTDSNK